MKVGHFGDLDTERWQRTGTPEAILAEGKRDDHLRDLAGRFVAETGHVLVTRLTPDRVDLVQGEGWTTTYHEEARMAVLRVGTTELPRHGGRVAILAAGTADVGVAEEARITAHETGSETARAYDVGVAGPHRLVEALEELPFEPHVYICAAGREAALPVVLAAQVEQPVIAVPTSVGYGHGGGGEAALKGVLQACAPLVTVNIDAGFPAGVCASKIARQAGRTTTDART